MNANHYFNYPKARNYHENAKLQPAYRTRYLLNQGAGVWWDDSSGNHAHGTIANVTDKSGSWYSYRY